MRLRAEGGFGMLELLMAMVLLNVGILALVASLQAGSFALHRAGKVSTASVLADSQMELYRGLRYCSIAFDTSEWNTAKTDPNYTADAAYPGGSATVATSCTDPGSATIPPTITCATPVSSHPECQPIRSVTGPDHHRYRVDTYLAYEKQTAPASRSYVKVTVVARDAAHLTRSLARQTSTFDQSTGA